MGTKRTGCKNANTQFSACVWVLGVAGHIKDSPVSFGSGEGATNEDTSCDGGVHRGRYSVILNPSNMA